MPAAFLMNATSLILGVISLLLLLTLVLTVNNLQPADTSTSDHQALRREIRELREETETLRRQSALRRPMVPTSYPVAPAPQAVTPPPMNLPTAPSATTASTPLDDEKAAQIAELERQLAESEESNAELNEKVEKAERRKDVAEREAGLAYEQRTKAAQKRDRAMRDIGIAMKLATVSEVNTEYAFVVFEAVDGRQFTPGQTLGIRRNAGILGLVRVEQHSQGDSYTGTILPNSYAGAAVPVQPGDELILPPDSFVAKNPEAGGVNADASSNSGAAGGTSNEPMLELPPVGF